MVFIDWKKLGICPNFASPNSTCYRPSSCPWDHPPRSEITKFVRHAKQDRLYEAEVTANEAVGSRVPAGGFASFAPAPPTSFPLPQPVETGTIYLGGRTTDSTPPPPPGDSPSSYQPPETMSRQTPGSHRSGAMHYTPDSDGVGPRRRPPPPASYEFDPRRSRNPYVNGDWIYHFAVGNPLCVRCGTTGHLPKDCHNAALSLDEQGYLYQIMRDEQARSKMDKGYERDFDRGLDRGLDSRQYTPTSAAEFRPPPPRYYEPSMLDAPPSPKTLRIQSLASQEDVFRQFSEQQADKPRKWSREEGEITSSRASQSTIAPSRASQSTIAPPNHEESKRSNKRSRKKNDGKKTKSSGLGHVVLGEDQQGPGHAAPANLQLDDHGDHTLPDIALVPAEPSDAPVSLPEFASFIHPSRAVAMGATKRLSNGEAKAVGPHPSTIRVSASYLTQAAIEKKLQPTNADPQERSLAEAREDSVRLQGVTWLDSVRRALQLPTRTFTSACIYYHKFRLAHPATEYNWADAAAACLLTSCKTEDTLKKSRDILAAAYNLKQPAGHEQLGADDAIFEQPSRVVIGLERLVLESGGFDFRSRSPHLTLVKISKSLPASQDLKSVAELAWTIMTDLYRTFAPLKHTSSTLALACLELSAHFKAITSSNNTCSARDDLQALDPGKWYTTREEVMETLLDALDLYTHHTTSTIHGTKYSLDDFLRIRLALNKECSESNLPRYTVVQPPSSPDNATGTDTTLRVSNGHPTPVSPPQQGTQTAPQSYGSSMFLPVPEGGGTVRFMLNPQRATEEKAEVNRYYTEEWEEYEEEIEVPIPRPRSRDRDRDRHRDNLVDNRSERGRYRDDDRRSARDDRDTPRGRPPPDGDRDRDRLRDREHEAERERTRLRDQERDTRYDDRRRDDRERPRRYDERRGTERERDRDRDRRYYDEDRRRGTDRR